MARRLVETDQDRMGKKKSATPRTCFFSEGSDGNTDLDEEVAESILVE